MIQEFFVNQKTSKKKGSFNSGLYEINRNRQVECKRIKRRIATRTFPGTYPLTIFKINCRRNQAKKLLLRNQLWKRKRKDGNPPPTRKRRRTPSPRVSSLSRVICVAVSFTSPGFAVNKCIPYAQKTQNPSILPPNPQLCKLRVRKTAMDRFPSSTIHTRKQYTFL